MEKCHTGDWSGSDVNVIIVYNLQDSTGLAYPTEG